MRRFSHETTCKIATTPERERRQKNEIEIDDEIE